MAIAGAPIAALPIAGQPAGSAPSTVVSGWDTVYPPGSSDRQILLPYPA